MEINFIVTCFDKEEYLFGINEVFKSYKIIIPRVIVAYNGNFENFPCDIRIPNRGHQLGDIDLTLAGYKALANNGNNRFIKICIDSWLLDENIIIEIFNQMSKYQCSYAGNYWFENSKDSLSTDIFFVDTNFGNVFENFMWDGFFYETSMFKTLVKMKSNIAFLTSRDPVVPTNRFQVDLLNWTMSHDIKENLKKFWEFNSR